MVYINGTGSLIKRGFNRYYIQKNRETSTLKGKINISWFYKGAVFSPGEYGLPVWIIF